MAKKANSTTAFTGKLLAPLPEGERMEDRAFDADEWITRLRSAGGDVCELGAYHKFRLKLDIDLFDPVQWALAKEAHSYPLAQTEIRAALKAREDRDAIEIRLKWMRSFAKDLKNTRPESPEYRMARAISVGTNEAFADDLRKRGVAERVIQAAMAGEMA